MPKKSKKTKKTKEEKPKKRGRGRPKMTEEEKLAAAKKRAKAKAAAEGGSSKKTKKKDKKEKTSKKRGRPPGKKATKKKATKKVSKKTAKKKSSKKSKSTGNKPLTKAQVASCMADRLDIKPAVAKQFLSELVSLATSEVKKKGSFSIPGLGKLVKKRSKARKGRNPATGESIRIKAKTTIKARLSKAFKESV